MGRYGNLCDLFRAVWLNMYDFMLNLLLGVDLWRTTEATGGAARESPFLALSWWAGGESRLSRCRIARL